MELTQKDPVHHCHQFACFSVHSPVENSQTINALQSLGSIAICYLTKKSCPINLSFWSTTLVPHIVHCLFNVSDNDCMSTSSLLVSDHSNRRYEVGQTS